MAKLQTTLPKTANQQFVYAVTAGVYAKKKKKQLVFMQKNKKQNHL